MHLIRSKGSILPAQPIESICVVWSIDRTQLIWRSSEQGGLGGEAEQVGRKGKVRKGARATPRPVRNLADRRGPHSSSVCASTFPLQLPCLSSRLLTDSIRRNGDPPVQEPSSNCVPRSSASRGRYSTRSCIREFVLGGGDMVREWHEMDSRHTQRRMLPVAREQMMLNTFIHSRSPLRQIVPR